MYIRFYWNYEISQKYLNDNKQTDEASFVPFSSFDRHSKLRVTQSFWKHVSLWLNSFRVVKLNCDSKRFSAMIADNYTYLPAEVLSLFVHESSNSVKALSVKGFSCRCIVRVFQDCGFLILWNLFVDNKCEINVSFSMNNKCLILLKHFLLNR